MAVTQPAGTHLAHFNLARGLDDMASPRLAEFVAALDRVNGIAERSPGFVWRLSGDGTTALDSQVTDDPRVIASLSVWETPGHFANFVWNTVHKRMYDKKADWFEVPTQAHIVMWWIPAGEIPTVADGHARLARLRSAGPAAGAFAWESLASVAHLSDKRFVPRPVRVQ